MLAGERAEAIRDSLEHIEHVLAASGELSEHARKRYEHIRELFGKALERVEPAEDRQALVALHDEVAAEAKAEVAARDEVKKMLEDAETKVDPNPAKAAPAKPASRSKKAAVPKATVSKATVSKESGDAGDEKPVAKRAPRKPRKR